MTSYESTDTSVYYFDDRPELLTSYQNQLGLIRREAPAAECIHGVAVASWSGCHSCRYTGTPLVRR